MKRNSHWPSFRRLHPHSGSAAFALMELPIALLVLVIVGLFIAGIIDRLAHGLPWYGWVIATIALPLLLILTGLIRDRRTRTQHLSGSNPPQAPNDSNRNA